MKKRVVIAGFGDTGLLVAVHLKKRYDIVGISPKPCLVSGQELGTRLTQPERWKKDYLVNFERYKALEGVTTVHGVVDEVWPELRQVVIKAANGLKTIERYDVLVLASGVSNGFWRTNRIENMADIQHQLALRSSQLLNSASVAIVGAGPTGVSVASNVKEISPDTQVHLFFSQDKPLPGYHPKTRAKVVRKLMHQGVNLHAEHRATLPDPNTLDQFGDGELLFSSGQATFKADKILWAVGNLKPNNDFIPSVMLNEQGFVKADRHLRVPGFNNIFTVGDIADTDPLRSSARNAGFLTVAHNIDAYLQGKPASMKVFKPAKYRWGSILGVQKRGMRVFTPKGGSVRISKWWVDKLLFPLFVRQMIYKGLYKSEY